MGKSIIQFPNQIRILLTLLLITSLLLPPLKLFPDLPKFHATEFLLPFLLIAISVNFNKNLFYRLRFDLLVQVTLAVIIILSMIFNSRINQLRDWFEIIEVFKYLVLFLFVGQFAHLVDFRRIIKGLFLTLLLFNFFQYFNFFEFNDLVEIYYGSDIQVSTFGLNSLGQPDTKRLLGTLGNPNNNAILFLFFSIYFFPERNDNYKEVIFFLLAMSLLLMCQSRTTTITFLVVFFLGAYLKDLPLKKIVVFLLYFSLVYLLLWSGGNSYLNTLANNPMKENSVKSRMETFQILTRMIIQSPIIGHGPNKEFFDKNGLNADNEYILYTWRYGFLGLSLYLLWLIRLAISGWKSRINPAGLNLFLFILGIGILTLTNSPLSNPYLLFLLAVFAGLHVNQRLNDFSA